MSVSEFKSEKEFLKHYNIHDYDVPLVSVDVSIFTLIDGQLNVLLIERGQFPQKGKWALPGGFINLKVDKSLDDTATRTLREKTGVATPYVEQVASFGSPKRDPRGWSVTVLHMALIPYAPTQNFVDSVADAKWWPYEQAVKLDLAFDHAALLDAARERLRNKTAYTLLPIHLLDAPFTLTGLQSAFEELIGKPLEKKSFRRRIDAAKVLEEVATTEEGIRGRPAAMFKPCKDFDEHVFRRVFGDGND